MSKWLLRWSLAVAAGTVGIARPVMAKGSFDPTGFWLTEDAAVIVAIDRCAPDTSFLCGLIVAIPGAEADDELRDASGELCGAPLLWGLKPRQDGRKWIDGRILDVETEVVYGAELSRDGERLRVRAYVRAPAFGETLYWTRAKSVDPCTPFEGPG